MRLSPESRFNFAPLADRSGGGTLDLPVWQHRDEIEKVIDRNDNLVVVADTATGKTTNLPIFIHRVLGPQSLVSVTQPRSLAATEQAAFVARTQGVQLGYKVGYIVRNDHKAGRDTRICFMTDGVLLRMLQSDPLLTGQSAVMLDEAHERGENLDLAAGLLKRAQAERRRRGMTPLKIVISSATINAGKFSSYYDDAPIIRIEGRKYNVVRHFEDKTPYDADEYTSLAAKKASEIISRTKEGNILIFMPTTRDINTTIDKINAAGLDVDALPLHAGLTKTDKDRVFQQTGRRHIVVATNIAETTITPPNNFAVIDTGLIKEKRVDPLTGMETYPVVMHSQAGCDQRAGRAGREYDGEYHALYTYDDYLARPRLTVPEILRSNLAAVALRMKAIGIDDIRNFDFLDRPDKEQFSFGIAELIQIGALDAEERLTDIGREMAELPLDPRVARMVVEAKKVKKVGELCTIAAFLSTGRVDRFLRAVIPSTREASDSDYIHFLEIWNELSHIGIGQFSRTYDIPYTLLQDIRAARKDLLERCDIRVEYDTYEIQNSPQFTQAVVAGLKGNIMYRTTMHDLATLDRRITGIAGAGRGAVIAALAVEQKRSFKIPVMAHNLTLEDVTTIFPNSKVTKNYFVAEGEGYVRARHRVEFAGRVVEFREDNDTSDEAFNFLAARFADGTVVLPDIVYVYRANQRIVDMVNTYAILSKGKIPFVTTESITAAYKVKILEQEMTRIRGVRLQASDFVLSEGDFISVELRQELVALPTQCTFEGVVFPIVAMQPNKELTRVTAILDVGSASRLRELGRLPTAQGDMTLAYQYNLEGQYIIGESISDLKEKVAKEDRSRQLRYVSVNPYSLNAGLTELKYGRDFFTGEPHTWYIVRAQHNHVWTGFETRRDAERFMNGDVAPVRASEGNGSNITWNSLRRYGVTQLYQLIEGVDNINRQRALLILLHKDEDAYSRLIERGFSDVEIMTKVGNVIANLSDDERRQARVGVAKYCARVYLRQAEVIELIGSDEEHVNTFIKTATEEIQDEDVADILNNNAAKIGEKAYEILEKVIR